MTAFGTGNIARRNSEFVCGKYNNWNSTKDYLFSVGNGTNNSNRSDAFGVDVNGNGYFKSACYANNVQLTGADYAEFFKWKNIPKEKLQSLFVTLDEDKIRLANKEDDYILGIVSNNPGIVGNNLMDSDRENNPEWVIVGLMGQIEVEDDGTCKPNKYCYPGKNGVATASETGYRVMKRIDDNHILVMFK